jgi:hypothetical protein
MSLRRRALCLLAALSTMVGAALPGVAPATAAPSITIVTAVPSVPLRVATHAGVDGVRLSWWRGSVTADAPAPTLYVVRRRADGYDLNWVVPTDLMSNFGGTSDTTLPVGLPATYTVAARNAAGDSDESPPASATVPAWEGPYDPARKVLTMVWDEAEAAGGPLSDRATTQATADSTVPLAQGWENGDLVGFSSGPGSAFALSRDTPDGDYTLGIGDGLLNVSAVSGARCSAYGASASGTASVRHTAPSLSGGYASITVDADLVCGDGHRLRVELRWSTSEDFHTLGTAPLTVLEAQPDQVATRDITVTNTGSLDATLGAARFIDSDMSTSAPLTVTRSTCDGLTIAPGQSCKVTVDYTAGPAGSKEGNGILVVPADLGEVELGRVVGQQPVAVSGPQNITVTGAPGRVDLSWTAPRTLDDRLIDSWRIEEDTSPSPTVLQRIIASYVRSSRITGLSVGAHQLRVVMHTGDGREISSAPLAVTVPRRWLLVATTSGVRALNPDGGNTDGGLFGSALSASGVAFSPVRDRVIASYSLAGRVEALSGTGSLLRVLTLQPVFGDDGPAVSPDGARVMLHRAGYTGSETRDSSLVLVPAVGGAETVVPASSGLSAPDWTPDGTAVVAVQNWKSLVRVAPATGARTPLPGTALGSSPFEEISAVSVSRMGRVAYAATVPGGGRVDIRLTSLTGGTFTLLGAQDALWDLAWDPSGRWLAATGGPYESPQHTYVYDTTASPALVRTLDVGGSAVAWLDTASSAPVVSLTAPAWTTRTASLTVDATDSDDAVGGLRRECRLDAATTWTACGSTWFLSALAPGQHTAYARATDPSGSQSAAVTRSWNVDAAAPTAALGTVQSVLAGAAFTLTWTAADSGGSGLASYDARVRYAASSGRFGGYVYPTAWQGLRARSLALRLGPGYQYCFSTRARDVAGNLGAWSAERCTAVALDDRAMSATSGWTRGTSTAFAYGTWSRAARAAVSLSRGSVQGRRIALVATTCPTCGSVDVYHAGIKLGRVSLYSAKTAYRQLRWLPLQPVTRTGTVLLRTTSSNVVYIDGVAVLH